MTKSEGLNHHHETRHRHQPSVRGGILRREPHDGGQLASRGVSLRRNRTFRRIQHRHGVRNGSAKRDVETATAGGSQSTEESNRRRAAAEAGLAEIKLAQVCREVVRVADVASVVGDDYASLRSRLLSVAGHVEQRVAHLVEPDTLAKVTALVRDEVCEALEELSGANEIAGKALDDAD